MFKPDKACLNKHETHKLITVYKDVDRKVIDLSATVQYSPHINKAINYLVEALSGLDLPATMRFNIGQCVPVLNTHGIIISSLLKIYKDNKVIYELDFIMDNRNQLGVTPFKSVFNGKIKYFSSSWSTLSEHLKKNIK